MNGSVNILAELRQVLDIEIEALHSVKNNFDGQFVKAVEALHACQGQVVVTGIGKSGIVAKKIASTLRSTGTAAVFLHAGEALHGDLGLVRPGDVVLAIGKSGESTDLNAVLRILRKSGTTIIALTSSPDSAMAGLSDIVLNLKIPREACPLNLAPTASTTATIAVGDALAVVLMKLKNISKEDFASRHPGGQIGARLLFTVSDVMRKGPDNPIIASDQSIKEMIVRITAFRVGAISVVNSKGELLGLVTDYDIRRALESDRNLFSMKITDVMNPSPDYISAGAKAVEALEMMRHRTKPTAILPVIDDEKKVVGMVHLHDLLAAGL
jgi:arabinose-5-phosphate isomerase